MNRIRALTMAILMLAGTVLVQMPARAQMCDSPYEVIVSLRPPRLGVPTVWDAAYGRDDRMIQLQSGLPLEGGTVLATGRALSKENFAPLETVFVEMNRRGRVLMEKTFPTRDAEVPVKMIALKSGYLVLSNVRGGARNERRQVRLSWYDKKINFKKDIVLSDPSYDYDGHNLSASAEDNGFVVVAHAINHKLDSDQHGMLFRFSQDGQELWRRAYRPGISNQIYGLEPLADEKGYIATGRIRIDDGRMAGWVMKLSYDGTVLWQRTYPRGAFAALKRAVAVGGGERRSYMLMGDTIPLDGKPGAVWLMAIEPLGEPQWQRYFRRDDMAFSTLGLMRGESGRYVLALNAKMMEGAAQRDHVRMLILSSHGVVLEDETYFEGTEARANDFVRGWNGERVVIATIEAEAQPLELEMKGDSFVVAQPQAETDEEGQPAPGKKEKPVLKGWIFVATALDPYEDPCLNVKSRR